MFGSKGASSIPFVLFALCLQLVFAIDLKPVKPDFFNSDEAQHGRTRRDEDTSPLDLKDCETFMWAANGVNKIIYANLTMCFREEFENVISMESFADSLQSVECSEEMVLEFNDDAAYDRASARWDWVNGADINEFVMVANAPGCGPDAQRQPFVVRNVRYDETTFTAYLSAEQRTWEEVAHTYHLRVSHMPHEEAAMLLARDDPDFSMDLSSDFSGQFLNEFIDGIFLTADCTECGTSGELDVDIDVDVGFFDIDSASMTVTPTNLAAFLNLAVSVSGSLNDGFDFSKTVVSVPIQGITIAGVVELGAFLDVDLGLNIGRWIGTANIETGGTLSISDDSAVTVDIIDADNNDFSGWEPTFEPAPFNVSARIDALALAFAQPAVRLKAEALGKGINLGLNLRMPFVEAKIGAEIANNGACDEEENVFGVDVQANIGVDLSVAAAKADEPSSPFFKHILFQEKWPLFDECFAFGPEVQQSSAASTPALPPATASETSLAGTTSLSGSTAAAATATTASSSAVEAAGVTAAASSSSVEAASASLAMPTTLATLSSKLYANSTVVATSSYNPVETSMVSAAPPVYASEAYTPVGYAPAGYGRRRL